MKRLSLAICAVLALGAAAIEQAFQPATQQRRERTPRRVEQALQPATSKAPKLRIHGGTNADKPLYGICIEAYDGPLFGASLLNSGTGTPARIAADGQHVKLSDTNVPACNGVYINGDLFVVEYRDGASTAAWKVYDTADWSVKQDLGAYVASNECVVPYALTFDPVTGDVYGYFYKDATRSLSTSDAILCKVNFDNLFEPTTKIGDSGVRMRCLAANADGKLYAVGMDGNFYEVNKFDGSITKIAAIDYESMVDLDTYNAWLGYIPDFNYNFLQGMESAVIDWETGDMYMSLGNAESDTFIFKIDPADGSATLMADYGYWGGGIGNTEQFSALWFGQTVQAAAAGTPAAVTGLTATAQGVDLAATVEFTMPAVDTDGAALSGNLDWTIADATSTLATGSAAAGSKVTTTVTVPAAALYSIVVTAKSGSNVSAPVSTQVFIGPDTPVIDASPVAIATADGMRVAVAWHTPTGQNGGNLAEPITFRVVRMPEGKMVAEAAEGKQFVDALDSDLKAVYTYEVTPTAGTVTGPTYTSRSVSAGVYFGLPHEYDFTRKQNEDIFNQYPTLNVNNDGQDWYIGNYGLTHPTAADSKDSNDFLLIGPFKLNAGQLYNFSFVADNHSMTEMVAAYVGTNPEDANSFLANPLVEPTWIGTTNDGVKLTGKYTAPTSGAYYFAIHACSPSNRQNLYIKSVSLTTVSNDCPAAVTGLTATPAKEGITLSFTLPNKTLGGAAAGLTAFNVYRKGDLAATVTANVADGAKITWLDPATPAGSTDYTVAAVNAAGEGAPADANAWGGLDTPGTPHNFSITEDINTPGLMHFKWEAPTVGTHGGWVDPENITYYIEWQSFRYGRPDEPVKVGVGTTSYDMQMSNVTAQDILSASVYGTNWAGDGRANWNTKSGFYGPALPLPLRESWTGGSQKSGYWSYQSLVDKPGLFESYCDANTGEATGLSPQDGDGYMMLFSTTVAGRGVRMRSPRVELGNAANPTLVFYYLYTTDCLSYSVDILVDDKPWTELQDLVLPAAKAGQWQRCEISLKEFVGKCKYLQIGFTAKGKVAAEQYAAFDNVSIYDYVEDDLMITSFSAPDKVDTNTYGRFTLTLRNNGAADVKATDYTVSLYKNGEKVSTIDGKFIGVDATATLMLADMPSVADPAVCEYYAEVNFDADQDDSNNRTATAEVRIVTPDYPYVKDLQATVDNGVTLTWSAPSTDDMPDVPVTENWDSYTAFAISGIGDWTLRDGDQKPTVVLALPLIGQLDYPNIGQPMAWQVMDPDAANIFAAAWYARSGKQFLASFQACENGSVNAQSDDWLISPELNGKEQTISFFATAAMSSYSPEALEVRYSTTGTETADFKLLEAVDVPYNGYDWTEFSFRLPAGAKYFALVHKSYSKLALLLDDLTYTPAGATPMALELKGFNVYRDGARINSALVTDTKFIDTEINLGDEHSYGVSTLWDKGESPLSNVVTINPASLNEVGTYQLTIQGLNRAILIKGGIGESVNVYTVAGQHVASATAQDEVSIPVQPGIYIVRAGNTAAKVLVK